MAPVVRSAPVYLIFANDSIVSSSVMDALGSYDLGLIQLATPVTDITPSPINLNAAAAPVGTIVTMVGHGITDRNGTGDFGVRRYRNCRRATTPA